LLRLDELEEPPPLPRPELEEPPPPVDGRALRVVVVGAVVVCLVGVGLLLLGVVLVGRVVVGVVVVLVSDTNSVVPGSRGRLALVAVELDGEPDEDEEEAVPFSSAVSWSWAAVRFASAWSSVYCAGVGSSVASSWP
jgi:hypothetical protein